MGSLAHDARVLGELAWVVTGGAVAAFCVAAACEHATHLNGGRALARWRSLPPRRAALLAVAAAQVAGFALAVTGLLLTALRAWPAAAVTATTATTIVYTLRLRAGTVLPRWLAAAAAALAYVALTLALPRALPFPY